MKKIQKNSFRCFEILVFIPFDHVHAYTWNSAIEIVHICRKWVSAIRFTQTFEKCMALSTHSDLPLTFLE